MPNKKSLQVSGRPQDSCPILEAELEGRIAEARTQTGHDYNVFYTNYQILGAIVAGLTEGHRSAIAKVKKESYRTMAEIVAKYPRDDVLKSRLENAELICPSLKRYRLW